MTVADNPIVQKLAAQPKKPGKRFTASVARADEPIWRKVLLIGRSGVGKTRALAGVLLNGQRVFVADTDFGGNGLSTVVETLREVGRLDLLPNLSWYEFNDYKSFVYFLDYPDSVDIDGKSLWEWNPDVIALDGFSNLQESHITEYSLSLDPIGKADAQPEARNEGLWIQQTDWGVIRRATLHAIEKFLRIHNPNGKRISKIVTVLQDSGKEDRLTGETRKGPLIVGAARDYLTAGFDLILTLDVTQKPGAKEVEYWFKCDVADRSVVAKKRGLQMAAKEAADFESVWKRISNG